MLLRARELPPVGCRGCPGWGELSDKAYDLVVMVNTVGGTTDIAPESLRSVRNPITKPSVQDDTRISNMSSTTRRQKKQPDRTPRAGSRDSTALDSAALRLPLSHTMPA